MWWRGLLACGTSVERSSLAGMGIITGGFCTVTARVGGCCAAVGASVKRLRFPGPDITALCALLRCTFRYDLDTNPLLHSGQKSLKSFV